MALPLLRAMTVDDLDAAMLIERVSFQQPWSRHMYWMDLSQNELATYVVIEPAESDRELMPPVLAYGGFWLIFDEAHVATIASHPDWRRCGLGAFALLGLLEPRSRARRTARHAGSAPKQYRRTLAVRSHGF